MVRLVSSRQLSDVDIRTAADALLAFVTVPHRQNEYFPEFAKEKIAWLRAQVDAGRSSVIVLKDLSHTTLGADDLMASGVIDGRQVIVIAYARFAQLLAEGGRAFPPFSEQQRNDFMLGLVHEIVHLQGAPLADRARADDRIREEVRTWREVSLNVVRPLRRLSQRMHRKFIRVDEALRECGDLLPCADFVTAVVR
jgi:hypothetical protein